MQVKKQDRVSPRSGTCECVEDITARHTGNEREVFTHHALEVLQTLGWITGFVPSGKLSVADRRGTDIFVTIAGQSRYEDFPLSVAGPGGLRDHQERHPEIPNVIVNLDTQRNSRLISVEIQVIATLALERLKRSGRIIDYSIDGEFENNGVRNISFCVVKSDCGIEHIAFAAPQWVRRSHEWWSSGPLYLIAPTKPLRPNVIDSEILLVIQQ